MLAVVIGILFMMPFVFILAVLTFGPVVLDELERRKKLKG